MQRRLIHSDCSLSELLLASVMSNGCSGSVKHSINLNADTLQLLTPSRIFQSGCVKIRAGNDEQLLPVHETVLLNSDSPSLRKLVQPGWKESSEGYIEWKHTSVPTVKRVLSYLYCGDYYAPDPTPREIQSQHDKADECQLQSAREAPYDTFSDERIGETLDVGTAETEADDKPLNLAFSMSLLGQLEAVPGDEDPELQDAILESCNVRPLTPLGSCVGLAPITTMRKTAGGLFEDQEFPYESYSYQAPLLTHAEVYAFADYHGLLGLQQLALQRTVQTLRKIECSAAYAAQELSEVIKFIYDNVPAKGDDEDPMRKLLSQFAAINYTSLLHGSFRALYVRGGDFTLDLGKKLLRRLSAHGVAAELSEEESDRHIRKLRLEIQERDESIRSLNTRRN